MSIDNGVYVLYTETDDGPEYRVAYAHAIDNIYGDYDDESKSFLGNEEAIKNTFSESEVFYSLDEAVDKAEQISYDHDYLEDGICVISEFKDLNPF